MPTPKLTTGTLSPAYGAHYTSARLAKEAFLAGKDWKSAIHGYCSIRNFAPGAIIELRFGRGLQHIAVVTLPR